MMQEEIFQEYPALFAGLAILLGCGAPLFPEVIPWTVVGILIALYFRKWLWLSLLLASALYGYCSKPPHVVEGERVGYFHLSSLQTHTTPFEKRLLYRGTLYVDEGALPCQFSVRREGRPPGNSDLIVRGTLREVRYGTWSIKLKEWEQVEGTFRFAELRHRLKERFRAHLTQLLSTPKGATLFASLLTGEVEDRQLRYDFGRTGLQHLLAISGFHFALLLSFCNFFLQPLPSRYRLTLLALLVTLYYLFVGPSPAVERSWLTALFYLLQEALHRSSKPLNLLGAVLGLEIVARPLVLQELAFQLSFLSAAGILLLSPLTQRLLSPLSPRRTLEQLYALSFPNQLAAIPLLLLRSSLCLSLSVNAMLLPWLLYHFHQFPLLSLLYNLFCPPFISLLLFLLLLGLLLPFLPWNPPLFLADRGVGLLLQLLSAPPLPLDHSLLVSSVPPWLPPLLTLALASYALLDEFRTSRLT